MIDPGLDHYSTDQNQIDRCRTLLAALTGELAKLSVWEHDAGFGAEPVNPDDFEELTVSELEEYLTECIIGEPPQDAPDDDDKPAFVKVHKTIKGALQAMDKPEPVVKPATVDDESIGVEGD